MNLTEQMEFRKLLSAALEKWSTEGQDPTAVMSMVVALECWVDKVIEDNVNRALKEIVFKKDKSRN